DLLEMYTGALINAKEGRATNYDRLLIKSLPQMYRNSTGSIYKIMLDTSCFVASLSDSAAVHIHAKLTGRAVYKLYNSPTPNNCLNWILELPGWVWVPSSATLSSNLISSSKMIWVPMLALMYSLTLRLRFTSQSTSILPKLCT